MWCNAFLVSLAALCFGQGEALKCYQCTSASTADCGDPINSSVMPTDCTPQSFKDVVGGLGRLADTANEWAGKIGVNLDLNVPDANAAFACVKGVKIDGEKTLVVRSCSVADSDKFDVCKTMRAQAGGLVTHCSSCQAEACNAAPAHAATAPAAALAAASALAAAAFARRH